MIKIIIKKNKDKIKEIIIKGHAEYADFGQDIVCASISSIATTTINGILSIYPSGINYEYVNESLIIKILEENTNIYKLIDNMIILFKELENDYKENISIIIKEV
ncbi:MAG: ribosomal-processing cysteine protease Prp [Bacilli bacterium]|nr:ribosomal-processing cysteine protease Prp [Bacilli bacterium]